MNVAMMLVKSKATKAIKIVPNCNVASGYAGAWLWPQVLPGHALHVQLEAVVEGSMLVPTTRKAELAMKHSGSMSITITGRLASRMRQIEPGRIRGIRRLISQIIHMQLVPSTSSCVMGAREATKHPALPIEYVDTWVSAQRQLCAWLQTFPAQVLR